MFFVFIKLRFLDLAKFFKLLFFNKFLIILLLFLLILTKTIYFKIILNINVSNVIILLKL